MSLYARTIANGGGTFTDADRDVTSGYAVAIVHGTFRSVDVNDAPGFDVAVDSCYQYAASIGVDIAVGTWVDGSIIHVDPVRIYTTDREARASAAMLHQLAYFHLDTQTELRLAA